MSLTITITDAGRAALVNAENSGTAPVTISEIALGSGQYAPTESQTALTNEFKRIDSISGEVVSDDTINVVLKDESSDDYQVGEFGLYTNGGVLFAVYSQPSADGWVAEKFAGSSFLLAVDVVLESLNATSLTFGDLTFTNPTASETVKGVVELADSTESVDRDNHDRVSTPKAVHEALAAFGLGSEDAAPVSDFNAVARSGLYYAASGANAAPSNNSYFFIHLPASAGDGYAAQIAVSPTFALHPGSIYFRVYGTVVAGLFGWSEWKRIWSEGSFNPDTKLDEADLAGSVMAFAMSTPPPGFLKANGAAVSRNTYSRLYNKIGTTFGDGDGFSTFNLPDLRDEFIRGANSSSGRQVGDTESDSIRQHSHTGTTDLAGSHQHTDTGSNTGDNDGGGSGQGWTGTHQTEASGVHAHTFTTDLTGGSETRPRNVALLYCIKY